MNLPVFDNLLQVQTGFLKSKQTYDFYILEYFFPFNKTLSRTSIILK